MIELGGYTFASAAGYGIAGAMFDFIEKGKLPKKVIVLSMLLFVISIALIGIAALIEAYFITTLAR